MKTLFAQIFNRITAQRQDPAVFDYEGEVTQAWQDFPEIKDKVFFFDASADAKLVYPAEGIAREKAQKLAQERDAPRVLKEASEILGGTSFCHRYGDDTRFIFLYMEAGRNDFLDRAAPRAQEIAFVFDHELAHAAIPGGSYKDGSKNNAESIADAYAVIRHLQRYGADSPFIDNIVAYRAFNFIFSENGSSHFTSPVTQKILACRYDIDWNKLTRAQTIEKAQEFVQENAMAATALGNLRLGFYRCRGRMNALKYGDVTPLQHLAGNVLSTHSSLVFKYGKLALDTSFSGQTMSLALKGSYWRKVRRQLAKKQKTFAQRNSQPAVRSQTSRKFG